MTTPRQLATALLELLEEEQDVFRRVDLPWIPPDERNHSIAYYGPGPATRDAWNRSQVTPP